MKLNLIYYKNILDIALEMFVKKHEECFTKDGSAYVLGLSASKKSLQKDIEKCIDSSIDKALKSTSSKDDVAIVIGSCYPIDNLLLDFKDSKYFPKKLSSLIDSRPALKWLLAEKDIQLDIDLFNEIAIEVFNKKFTKIEPKRSSISRPRVLYVSHSRLDCYMLFKTLKWAYGSSNCLNVWKETLSSQRQNLVAVNDLISKYIQNKSRMNKSIEFKMYALEVKDYLDEKLGIVR